MVLVEQGPIRTAKDGIAFTYQYIGQAVATTERLVLYAGDARPDCDAGKTVAAVECIAFYGFYAVGNHDDYQAIAV